MAFRQLHTSGIFRICSIPFREINTTLGKKLSIPNPTSCILSLSESGEVVKQQIASFEEDLDLILHRLGVLRTVYCNSAALVYGLFNNLSQW